MAMAMNLDASPKTLQFYRNGTAIGTAENFNTSATGHFAFMIKGHNQSTMTINAGQDSSFCGAKSTGTANASDGNGYGDFYYATPSGYLSLCSANIAVGTSIDPATTDDNHPVKNFNALIYSGDGTSSNAITGLGFQPDLIWIKERGGTNLYSHSMHDSLRGRDKVIFAEDTREE